MTDDDIEIGEPISSTKRSFKFQGLTFFDDELNKTQTSIEQKQCEMSCASLLYCVATKTNLKTKEETVDDPTIIEAKDLFKSLKVQETISYIAKTLVKPLSPAYSSLEASRGWILYWSLNAVALLKMNQEDELDKICVNTLKELFSERYGSFTGAIGHFPHTAAVYASVLSGVTIGSEEAFELLLNTRRSLYKFLYDMKEDDGSFRVQRDGEMDTRGLYTALCAADLLGILTPELAENSFSFVKQCQTYEGGFGGEKYNEAHGGYAFCAVATLAILKKRGFLNIDHLKVIDMKGLKSWIAQRQMSVEGGFQGRTNKLVDSCYSYWQGGIPVLYEYLMSSDLQEDAVKVGWMDPIPLVKYILFCCQDVNGGLKDKPGKNRDQYHTCYSVSGLSLAQHYYAGGVEFGNDLVLGKINPIYCVEVEKLAKWFAYRDSRISEPIHADLFQD